MNNLTAAGTGGGQAVAGFVTPLQANTDIQIPNFLAFEHFIIRE
jgi:hypothetical protein